MTGRAHERRLRVVTVAAVMTGGLAASFLAATPVAGSSAALASAGAPSKTISVSRKAPSLQQSMVRLTGLNPPLPVAKSEVVPVRVSPGLQRQIDAAVVADATLLRATLDDASRAREDGPTVTITSQTENSISGKVSQSFAGENGATVELSLDIGAKAKVGSETSLDFGLGIKSTTAEGATKIWGLQLRDAFAGKVPTCPNATGEFVITSPVDFTSNESESFGSAHVRLGSVKSAVSGKLVIVVRGSLGADARLRPAQVTATGSIDYARTMQGLAFLQSRQRVVGSTSLSGTLDPSGGQIRGASTSTRLRADGWGSDDAAAKNSFAKVLESLVRDGVARAAKSMKEIEANARAGKCTVIELSPATGGSLAPKASVGVKAVLKTQDGTVVKTVRWAATPAKGSVGPRSSNDSKPSFKVTGAPKGPQTASLTFKAVSPAGISSAPWTAGGKDDFPRTYAGKVTYTKTWDMGGGASDTTSWAVDVTYTLADQQANPDGTAQALYDLTSATISDFTYVMDSPAAGCSLDAPASGAARIVAGALEIRVSKGGAWTSGVLVDATIGKKPNTCITKTQPSVTVKGSQEVKTFINTRLATGDLRPMAASGAVAASGVTDVMELGSQLGVRGSASWDLEPGR
jgi:hypothetical protein